METERRVQAFNVKVNSGTAYWMARCAQAAYWRLQDGSPDANAILENLKSEDPSFTSVTPFHEQNSSAVVIEHQEFCVLAFRGTDDLKDWMDNINTVPISALFGSFHRGFFQATDRIWSQIIEYYEQRKNQIRSEDSQPRGLFLTGHSLGGAMATIAASHLVDRDVAFTGVYTFGQPRAVRAMTSDVFNARAGSRFHRFQNNNDVVTRVPARAMGYSHVGTSYVHILQNKKMVRDPGLWLRFLDAKDGIVDDIMDRDFATIEDHRMEDYLYAIKKWDVDVNSSGEMV